MDPALSPGAVYVYGTVEKLAAHRYAVKACQLVYGKLPANGRVEVDAEPTWNGLPEPGFPVSVVVKDRKILRRLDVVLNSCNQQAAR